METIEDIEKYFLDIHELNNDDKWKKGADLARSFINLRERAHDEASFKKVFTKVDSYECPSSVWFYMWQLLRNWGYQQGYEVPDDHPWGIDTKRISCIDHDSFEDALTKGQEYLILDKESKDGFIRVKDNNGRHSWFPKKCFETPRVIKRKYSRKLRD